MRERYVGPWVAEIIGATFGPAALEGGVYVDYSPRQGDVALRFDDPLAVDMRSATESTLIASVSVDGRYLNVSLSASSLQMWRGLRQPRIGQKVAVEHTSVTPVYPINIWSARSTVLGVMTSRALSLLGAETSNRFWFEETARNRAITQIPRSRPRIGSTHKADHEAGQAFFAGLAEQYEYGAEWLAARTELLDAGPIDPERDLRHLTHEDDLAIASGYGATLERLGATNVQFDFQRDIETRVDLNDIFLRLRSNGTEPSYQMAEMLGTRSTWTYAARNFVYFALLLQEYDEAISVVSAKQHETIAPILALVNALYAPQRPRMMVHEFGPVKVDGVLDSVKDGHFHTVDRHLVEDRLLDGFVLDVLTRGPEVPIQFGAYRPATSGRSREPSNASIRAALALDELPGLLERAIASCRFANLIAWNRSALRLRNEAAPELRAGLARVIDTLRLPAPN